MSVISTKSPLHPSALRIKDLTPGRRIIRFNQRFGILGEYFVKAKPYVKKFSYSSNPNETHFVVDLIETDGLIQVEHHYLDDMGIIPYRHQWNRMNFTIDARKRHLLPELIPTLYRDSDDEFASSDEMPALQLGGYAY